MGHSPNGLGRIDLSQTPLDRLWRLRPNTGQVLALAVTRGVTQHRFSGLKNQLSIGAGEGNRTLVISLEGCCSTIELHPRNVISSSRLGRWLACRAVAPAGREAWWETVNVDDQFHY